MISLSHFYERSLLVVASVLVWAAIVPQPLVMASPLIKSSSLTSSLSLSNLPIESKSGGTASPSEYVVVEEDSPILESLTKLLSSQPQVRMLRPNLEPRNSDSEPISPPYNSKDEITDNDNVRLGKLLFDYFRSNNNRLPRRFGSTSKRAAAMGVDLPDYILHINKGRNFDFSSFREKMQKSG